MTNLAIKSVRTITKAHRLLKVLARGTSQRWASIFFTRKCNLRCPYCRAYEKNPNDIPLSEWKKIIDRLANWGIPGIDIVGGEPTLRDDLCEFIEYISSIGMLPALHSNFTVLSKAMIDRLAEGGLMMLKVSLDSLGGFGKSNGQALDLLEYARTEKGLIPMISNVATSINIDQIPSLAQFVVEKKFFFTCGLYQCVGGKFSSPDVSLIPPADKTQGLFRFLGDLKARTGLVRNSFLFMESLDRYYDGLWKCDAGRDAWLTINNDGTLMPCQEYSSPISILQLDTLSDPAWVAYKRGTVQACKGCFYHCYFDAENITGRRLLREVKTGLNILKHS
jgi:MoaA/NifB/PqqE/SkfB family radical SAM enzyme